MKNTLVTVSFILLGLTAYTTASEPSRNLIMGGAPPDRENLVTFKNYRSYPYSKWAFHNIGAPLNILTIPREGNITELVQKEDPKLGQLELTDGFGNISTIEQILASTDTDGIVVLRDNKLLFERYYGDMNRHDHHIWFSATKSLVSTAIGILVEDDMIKLSDSPADYIPELKGSGFERTTIQNVLNHSSAIDFKENYTDINSDFLKYYGPALNLAYIPGGRDAQPESTDIYGVYDFLAKFIREDATLQPGDEFDYNSTNADVIGWLVARVAGMPLHDFIQEKIWSKLGPEHDALIAVDRAFMPVATGGMSTTLRDAALFGQMILNRGRVDDKQVIPARWVDQSLAVSEKDKQKMKNNTKYQDNSWTAYKNMWWIINQSKGEYAAVGVHGQVIYINRSANVVVAYFSSQAVASASRNPQFQSKLFAAQRIAQHYE
ncbi:MAG: serine hydrolase [Halieaceae bacterium]|jgi:CubicO group peptidase (beta-lactamase class C family)|nr:serine hydrolase [Halieaceae bacterium]